MIVFRHADPRYPFLWESAAQPAARWHGAGEGPAHYLAETADGAWAEFLRHEEITDPTDLAGVSRAIWAIDLPRLPRATPKLADDVMRGGQRSHADCQAEARRLRRFGLRGLAAPSAALEAGSPSGFRTEGGRLVSADPRPERSFVLFGPRPDLVAWAACVDGRPRADLLPRVRHF
jgi:hypothetical protein